MSFEARLNRFLDWLVQYWQGSRAPKLQAVESVQDTTSAGLTVELPEQLVDKEPMARMPLFASRI